VDFTRLEQFEARALRTITIRGGGWGAGGPASSPGTQGGGNSGNTSKGSSAGSKSSSLGTGKSYDKRSFDSAMNNMSGMKGDKPSASKAGKQTEGGTAPGPDATPQQKAAYRNELMKKGQMAAYHRRAAIDSGQVPGYSPGAVGSYDEADALTVIEKIALPAVLSPIPGAGLTYGAMQLANAYENNDWNSTMFGGDPGPQTGWSADQTKGANGTDDPRGLDYEERELVGRPLRAMPDEPADDQTGTTPGGSSGEYSDVVLADRRKPNSVLKQMLETML